MKEKIFLVDEDLKIGDRYKSVQASEVLLVETELEVDFTELNSRQK